MMAEQGMPPSSSSVASLSSSRVKLHALAILESFSIFSSQAFQTPGSKFNIDAQYGSILSKGEKKKGEIGSCVGVFKGGWIKVMGSTSIHEAQSVPKSPPIANTVHPLGVRHSGGVSNVRISVPYTVN